MSTEQSTEDEVVATPPRRLGVLIVVGLANGMVLMGVPPYVQTGVQGLLIIAAVAMAVDRSRARIVR